MNNFFLKIFVFVFCLCLLGIAVAVTNIDPAWALLSLWLWNDISKAFDETDK